MAKKYFKRPHQKQVHPAIAHMVPDATKQQEMQSILDAIVAVATPDDLEPPDKHELQIAWTNAPRLAARAGRVIAFQAGLLILEKWQRSLYLTSGEALDLLQFLQARESMLLAWRDQEQAETGNE